VLAFDSKVPPMTESRFPSAVSRRDFIKTAAAAAVAPAIVPSSVFARPAPSDTLRFGCIGVGRQGQADMQELIYRGLEAGARVVAVCDIDTHRLDNARWLAEKVYSLEAGKGISKGIDAYRDFRELLARKDIDGVLVVPPDFWHAPVAVAAAKAGKDVYLEKPLTHSVAEGRKLVTAVRENKRILQVGSQQRSSVHFLVACELARNERIGRLRTIRVWLPEDQGEGDPRPAPVPPNLDYEFWLGPTAEAPYCEDRVHPQMSYDRPGWMQVEPYCLGMIANWGAHMVDIAQWGNGTEHTGPVSVEASGEFPDRGLFNVHTKFHGEAMYANGVRLVMETGDPAGVRFEGDAGWVFVERGKLQASDPEILRWKPGQGQVKLYRSGNHMKNFLECVRSRREPAAPVEAGHRSNTICAITHIAMKLGRRLAWDPAAEKFVADEEANSRLDYPHREPWTI
jgi:myo-inositol 2-dehydrogenase/D-chiro-inositol 1-dehydrogenase